MYFNGLGYKVVIVTPDDVPTNHCHHFAAVYKYPNENSKDAHHVYVSL